MPSSISHLAFTKHGDALKPAADCTDNTLTMSPPISPSNNLQGGLGHNSTITDSQKRSSHGSRESEQSSQSGFESAASTHRTAISTACLQCEIKKLHCSLERPRCRRCQRTSEGPCLVQRRANLSDYLRAREPTRDAVLVRLNGDDQAGWEKKISLSEDVCYSASRTTKRYSDEQD